jgi:hypothetical protein
MANIYFTGSFHYPDLHNLVWLVVLGVDVFGIGWIVDDTGCMVEVRVLGLGFALVKGELDSESD